MISCVERKTETALKSYIKKEKGRPVAKLADFTKELMR